MGIATLTPFNSIIGPIDFYSEFYQGIFIQAASLTCNFAELLGTVFMILYGYKLSPKIFLLFPLYVWVICLIALPIIHLAIPQKSTVKTVISLIPVALCGITIAL